MTRRPGRARAAAGRLVRFASLVYEGILLVPVLFLAAYLFLAVAHDARHRPCAHCCSRCGSCWCCGVYFVYCWVTRRPHPGDEDLAPAARPGRRNAPSAGGAPGCAMRSACPACLLFGLGYLWAFIDRDGQFLHDRLAGTRIFMGADSTSDQSKIPTDTDFGQPSERHWSMLAVLVLVSAIGARACRIIPSPSRMNTTVGATAASSGGQAASCADVTDQPGQHVEDQAEHDARRRSWC